MDFLLATSLPFTPADVATLVAGGAMLMFAGALARRVIRQHALARRSALERSLGRAQALRALPQPAAGRDSSQQA